VLLFSPEFIEVRHIQTGRLVQVVSGTDIRMMSPGRGGNGAILIAMSVEGGDADDGQKRGLGGRNGGSWASKGRKYEQLVELEETTVISFPSAQTARTPSPPPSGSKSDLWEQWDM
jgi:hypothetical protein